MRKMIPCPTCNKDNPETAAFCGHCGAPLKQQPPAADSRAKTIFGYYNTLILLMDEERGELYLASSGNYVPTEVKKRRFKIGAEDSVNQVISTGEALSIPEVGPHERHIVSSPAVRSAVITPMFVGGKLVGIFEAESDRPNAFERRT